MVCGCKTHVDVQTLVRVKCQPPSVSDIAVKELATKNLQVSSYGPAVWFLQGQYLHCPAEKSLACGTGCPAPHPQRSGAINNIPGNRETLPRFLLWNLSKDRSCDLPPQPLRTYCLTALYRGAVRALPIMCSSSASSSRSELSTTSPSKPPPALSGHKHRQCNRRMLQ